jgi:hypothetical protein
MKRKSEAGIEKRAAPTSPVIPIPEGIRELLGPPPLLSSEDEALLRYVSDRRRLDEANRYYRMAVD